MALSQLEATMIARAISVARKAIEEVKPATDRLNVDYNAAGGASTTVTQANLDAATNLSGLTKAQLDDGMAALVALLTAIENSFAPLEQLAARG